MIVKNEFVVRFCDSFPFHYQSLSVHNNIYILQLKSILVFIKKKKKKLTATKFRSFLCDFSRHFCNIDALSYDRSENTELVLCIKLIYTCYAFFLFLFFT